MEIFTLNTIELEFIVNEESSTYTYSYCIPVDSVVCIKGESNWSSADSINRNIFWDSFFKNNSVIKIYSESHRLLKMWFDQNSEFEGRELYNEKYWAYQTYWDSTDKSRRII